MGKRKHASLLIEGLRNRRWWWHGAYDRRTMAEGSVPVGTERKEEDQATFLNRLKGELENGFNTPGAEIKLTYFEVVRVCDIVKEIFSSEPLILEIQSPVYVMGDIHGQFYDLLRIFSQIGSTDNRFLFLGDYVDRGPQAIEVVMYLFILKVLNPNKYFLLRGNHEDLHLSIKYGFELEVRRKFNDPTCFFDTIDVFNVMPISALIDGRIFCVHGGLSEEFIKRDFDCIHGAYMPIPRPTSVSEFSFVRDLLWADPVPDDKGTADTLFIPNPSRGKSMVAFGKAATECFFSKFGLKRILRGHEFCPTGIKYDHMNKCITVFSAPNYHNTKTPAAYILTSSPDGNDIKFEIMTISPSQSQS
ncbi:unnamed protein product [Rodentolepis nana]|uniref:Serine/threonine-protein phosphatase n=1 Tax=Rodentolepis nana TaxID=102285 RepID=A0A0R3T920_RODNA|nr:unnamed protein product [Rodentolepis nana]